MLYICDRSTPDLNEDDELNCINERGQTPKCHWDEMGKIDWFGAGKCLGIDYPILGH